MVIKVLGFLYSRVSETRLNNFFEKFSKNDLTNMENYGIFTSSTPEMGLAYKILRSYIMSEVMKELRNREMYEKALDEFIAARTELTEATVAYDAQRHAARKSLYDMKETGVRKMTEEQIRSESTVMCKEIYERYTKALGAAEIARERLEFVKAIINK